MKTSMTLDEIISITSNRLFATRESIEDALVYAERVAKATDNPGAVLTAIGVVMNAISDQLKEAKARAEQDNFDKLEAVVGDWVRAAKAAA